MKNQKVVCVRVRVCVFKEGVLIGAGEGVGDSEILI